ncbi:allene-oxide cyclase, partial [Trifolium medium]|nr:allene-oxide cyclase [Trifolium medium]
MHVYELNERDRGSPAYLRLSNKTVNSLGDLVPFSNKGIKDLPQELLGVPVEPSPAVEASPAAKALEPHAVIAGFS